VTLSVPADPDTVSSFLNIRVADIRACYDLWKSRGAEFITEPKEKYEEIRCYIRDPDGYIIEVGQSTGLTKADIGAVAGASRCDIGYRYSVPLNGGTRDGLETVGPVCAAG